MYKLMVECVTCEDRERVVNLMSNAALTGEWRANSIPPKDEYYGSWRVIDCSTAEESRYVVLGDVSLSVKSREVAQKICDLLNGKQTPCDTPKGDTVVKQRIGDAEFTEINLPTCVIVETPRCVHPPSMCELERWEKKAGIPFVALGEGQTAKIVYGKGKECQE